MEKNTKEEFNENAYDMEDKYRDRGTNCIPAKYGICSTCRHISYACSDLEKEAAVCVYLEEMRNWPNIFITMKHCSCYSQRGQLSLIEMSNMATYVETKKTNVGFSNDE